MKSKTPILFVIMVTILVIVSACGRPNSQTPSSVTVPEEITVEMPVSAQDESPVVPQNDIYFIQHDSIPVNIPTSQSGQASDFDSSMILESDTLIGGDRFTFNRYERPFNSTAMDVYYPEIDIVASSVYQDDSWIYGIMVLKDLNENNLQNVKYAVELDTTRDGKGDYLILATLPASVEWTVDSVQIYADTNKDVGGDSAYLTDAAGAGSDGFENLVFDAGNGIDPDAAWVRLSPMIENAVEFALKKSSVGSPLEYMINMWAGSDLLDPAKFDINDRYSHEEAGAADKSLENYYPIKAVAQIDNTCRMAVGFQPNGGEAGICPVLVKVSTGGPALTPGTESCAPTACESGSSWSVISCSCVTPR